MSRKLLFTAALIGAVSAFSLAPQASNAGTTDSVTVTASIANTCAFNQTTDTVAFGPYDPIVANASADITQTYTAQYTCTKGDAAYTFAFSSGHASGGACRMVNGSDASSFLTYTISDGTVSTYCAGAAHAAAGEAIATGSAQTYGFTFTLTHGQNGADAGSYTDTNTATIAP